MTTGIATEQGGGQVGAPTEPLPALRLRQVMFELSTDELSRPVLVSGKQAKHGGRGGWQANWQLCQAKIDYFTRRSFRVGFFQAVDYGHQALAWK